MTWIELDFFHNRRSLIHVNIYAWKFYSELCAEITEKEMKEMKIQITDDVIVYKPVIKKIWGACIKHGYIRVSSKQDNTIFLTNLREST